MNVRGQTAESGSLEFICQPEGQNPAPKKGSPLRCNDSAMELLSRSNMRAERNNKSVATMTQEAQAESTLDQHIDELIAGGETTDFGSRSQERRQKARIREPFPARIWGVDSGDFPFNMDGVVENISSTGLYLKTPRAVNTGNEVRLIVHFLSGPTTGVTASIQGRILRSELQPEGKHGLAIAIDKHRFL